MGGENLQLVRGGGTSQMTRRLWPSRRLLTTTCPNMLSQRQYRCSFFSSGALLLYGCVNDYNRRQSLLRLLRWLDNSISECIGLRAVQVTRSVPLGDVSDTYSGMLPDCPHCRPVIGSPVEEVFLQVSLDTFRLLFLFTSLWTILLFSLCRHGGGLRRFPHVRGADLATNGRRYWW